MLRFMNVIVLSMWFVSCSGSAVADEPLAKEAGLDYLKAASEIVASCDVSIRVDFSANLVAYRDESSRDKVKVRRPLPGDELFRDSTKFRFVSNGGKYRYEAFDQDSGKLKEICVINGLDWKHKRLFGHSGPAFSVRRDNSSICGFGADYRDFLGTHFANAPLHLMLRKSSSLHAKRDQDGKVILETDPKPEDASKRSYRIVLNPKHGLMVEELDEYYKGLPRRKSEVIEWHEFAKGTFAPVRMRTTGYIMAGDELAGEKYSVTDIVVDLSRSSWNRPVDPSLFELYPDSGSTVVDSVKGIMTMGSKGTPGENIDELANQPIKFSTGPLPNSNDQRKKQFSWSIIGAAGAAILLIAAGLWWRVRRVT